MDITLQLFEGAIQRMHAVPIFCNLWIVCPILRVLVIAFLMIIVVIQQIHPT
jgi:hypothetical protein